jgi:gas vesicle protein
VSNQNTLIAGGLIGAVVGVTASYLFFTEEGRQLREQLEANFDGLAREAEKFLGVIDQVRSGVAEIRGSQSGWQRTA